MCNLGVGAGGENSDKKTLICLRKLKIDYIRISAFWQSMALEDRVLYRKIS